MNSEEPGSLRQTTADLGRPALYTSALILLGALAIPLILANRKIGSREKLVLCALGILQTICAAGLLILAICWAVHIVRAAASGDPLGFPFGS